MNHILFKSVIFLCYVIITFYQQILSAKETEIKLCYQDLNVYPWQLGNGDEVATPPGLALDIISEAAREIGIKIKYYRVPNKRIFHELKTGNADGAFVFSFKKDRAKIAEYPMKDGKLDGTRRIASISYYFYANKTKKVNWDGRILSESNGQPVGVNRGYSIIEELKKMELPYEETKGNINILKKLQSNRISAYAGQDITIDHLLTKHQFENIVKLEPPIKSKDYFLIFSRNFYKEHKNIAEKLWTKMSQIEYKIKKERMGVYSNSSFEN